MKQTFHGPRFRVQLFVIDLTGEQVPKELRKEHPQFYVTTLPSNAHKSCPFYRGVLQYGGTSVMDAWREVRKYAPNLLHSPPGKWMKYVREADMR